MRKLLVLIVLVGAACSSEGDDAGPRLADPTTTVDEPGAETSTTEAETTTTRPDSFVVGDRVETASGNFITFFSYEQPVPNPEFITPEEGSEFAVADLELCLGSTPDQPLTVGGGDFELVMPDNSRADFAFVSAREPALNYTELSLEGDCVRGWVTFQPPVGVRPVRLAALYTDPQVRWSIP